LRPAARLISFAKPIASLSNGKVQNPNDELMRTRTTLINRLKNWQDQASWEAFFETYWRLIYGVAVKSGLTETEAQDVVQETMIAVAKHMPNFQYDRNVGSFKAWLMNMTRWRISDQFRQRDLVNRPHPHGEAGSNAADSPDMENIVDGAIRDMQAVWDEEWKVALFEAAMAKVKRSLDPRQYQIFDFFVNKGWPPPKIAETFGIPVGQVYLTKHRVTEAIKEEVERLKVAIT
jgi:RNA polymerase sigma-70 factor (ECF subfamily)